MKQNHKIMIGAVTGIIILAIAIHYIFNHTNSLIQSVTAMVATTTKEGMFTPETLDKFIILQSFNNPNTNFNLQQLSRQATEEDMKYYNTHGHWYWDDITKQAYEDDIQHNEMLQEYPKGTYMKTAQNTYNQNIMRQILSWRAPEGRFLMNGAITGNRYYETEQNNLSGRGTFPYTSGLLPKGDAVVVCNDDRISLKKMVGSSVPIYAPLDYNLLPTLVPGFKFLNKPCDPCGALKSNPDYSCPFTLGGKEPSFIWKYLWGI